jgi:AraC-like DNA-binding protein
MKPPKPRPILPLPASKKLAPMAGEWLHGDDPAAVAVAEPLFSAGVRQAAIFERFDLVRSEGNVTERHSFFLSVQGQLGVETGGKLHWLEPGDLALCPAGEARRFTTKKRGGFRCVFFNLRDSKRWAALKEREGRVRAYESADYMYLLTRRILNAYATHEVVAVDHARRDSYALLDLLMRELTPAARPLSYLDLALRDLVEHIRRDPGRDWTVKRMAARVNSSERTFLRAFHKTYGISPKQMVIKQRLALAAHRLVYSHDTLEAIARTVGYERVHSFSDAFLKHSGMRPGEFRQTRRKEQVEPPPT